MVTPGRASQASSTRRSAGERITADDISFMFSPLLARQTANCFITSLHVASETNFTPTKRMVSSIESVEQTQASHREIEISEGWSKCSIVSRTIEMSVSVLNKPMAFNAMLFDIVMLV